jgi:hypothetical protein
MPANSTYALVDALQLTDFSATISVATLFGADATARYVEAIDAGNIALVTGNGSTRVLPFTAGQVRVLQFSAVLSNGAGTTCTAVVVGL